MRKWNKLLAMLLAMVMVLGLTATAFAAEDDAKPEDEKTEDTTPAEGEEEKKDETTPAEGEEDKKDETTPAEGEEDKKDETTPAEGEEDKKDETTPAEGEEDKKDETTPAEGEDGKKDETAVSFSDVPEGKWYYAFVQKMAAAGIVNGNPDGTFKPDDTLTWGAALKMTIMFATGEEKAPAEGGNWASGYVAYVKDQGIWTEEIDHNAKITRLEMCQLLAKTLKLEESKAASKFSDTKDGYVMALVELGVIDGNPDGTFAPDGELTRAAMCKILASVPAAGDADKPAETDPAAPTEGEEEKKDETTPAEGEEDKKDETTPAEGDEEKKDDTTPAEGEDKGDDTDPDTGKGE